MINAKYRVRDVAKDLDVKTNYVTELIEKNFGGAKKSSMTALESDELDLLFDTVTKENAVDSFDEYFALKSKNEAPAKKEAPAAEQKSEQKEAAEKPAQKSAPAKDAKPAAKTEKPAAKAQEQAAKPAEDRPKKKNNNKPMQSRTKGERRTVDTRAGNVELDKYNERYENIAPANNGMQSDKSVHKQKLKQRSTQYRKQGMRSSRRETEAQRLARIAAERAKKPQIVVKIPDEIVVSDLAAMLKMTAAEVVKKLFSLGVMATVNQVIDYDTAAIVATELGAKAEKEVVVTIEDRIIDDSDDSAEDLSPRDPVVVVMGHVDHGKTSLLDAIRHTDVTATEAGGITQHIGAYRVDLNGQKITFLDTPGHAAFTSMRARGAQATDIAVLVVAADDGIMPQTIEAINHAKAANVPIVVAVNKIDKPGANPDKVRGQLTEYGLVPEEYGGNTMFVDISAKQGTNVDKLLEAVLLTADAELDLRANPDMDARGATVEARLDKGRGAVATVLVQSGTLHIGDAIVAGTSYGRVRAMLDENGNHMQEAGPSTPVQVLGLTSVPTAGDLFLVASDDRTARQIAEKRQATERAAQLAKRRKVVSLESLKEQFAKSEVDMLNIVIKGDSSGSVEALEDSLMKIEVSDEVGIQVIHRGVGAITQNDVNLATVDKAVIIGFNVRPNRQVADLAEREGVEIKYYSIIYKAIEDIEASLKGMLKPEYEEVVTSHSEIREIFRSSKFGNIAGVMVQDGEVKRGTKCRILRNGIATVNDLEISSLRRFKDDVNSVKEGYEAGINLGTFNDIEIGDIIETFEMQEIERK